MKTTSLISSNVKSIKVPKRNDERVILHFDYDCFYASVFENENPSLKSQPLGIKQKSILATCNYVARARGVKKLMLISEAQRICPDLIILNGEDLTRFRDASKKLWAFLRAHSWNRRVERLGLDEVFLDVTDIIAYNQETLNPHALRSSFFHLDRTDPVKGFAFDGSVFYGCVQPAPPTTASGTFQAQPVDVSNPLCVRLMLASHFAGYLRHKLDEDFGYTSSGGVATSKLLAKLAGSVNKPNNQTTLLAIAKGTTTSNGDSNGGSEEEEEDAVTTFLDAHSIRKIPGIGARMAQLIEEHILSHPTTLRDRESTALTVRSARLFPGMSPEALEQILSRPGAERGGGAKVWNLLHGVDGTEVKEAADTPTQISIEDTYVARPLQSLAEVTRELNALATALVRRMRVDLTEADVCLSSPIVGGIGGDGPGAGADAKKGAEGGSSNNAPRWLAYPKTLRLSTRTKGKPAAGAGAGVASSYNGNASAASEARDFSRSSRSAALPSFVFQFQFSRSSPSGSASASGSPPCELLAARLVSEALLPLFRRLHPPHSGWNLTLLNICVTNMALVARADDGGGGVGGVAGAGGVGVPGRDIGRMFRTQEDKLREWTVYDPSPPPMPGPVTVGSASDRAAAAAEGGDNDSRAEIRTGEYIVRDGKGGLALRDEGDGDKNRDEGNSQEDGGSDRNMHDHAETPRDSSGPITDDGDGDDGVWDEQEESDLQRCPICGHMLPVFAMSAHERFHAMG